MRRKTIMMIISLIGLSSLAVLGTTSGLLDRMREVIAGESFSGTSVKNKNPETNEFPTLVDNIDSEQVSEGENKISSHSDNRHEIETPEHILWGVLFRYPERFERLAEAARQRGKSDALWTDGFVRKTKLSLENAEIFKQKALEYSNELLPLTERGREIGLQYKLARESGTRVPEDLALRKERSELQEKRKELALKYRDEFHKAIDEEAFKAFEEWVKTEFVKNFHTKKFSGKDIYKAKVENGEISSTEKNIPENHHK